MERSYVQVDEDRYSLEHAIDTLSREMRELYETISGSTAEHAALSRVATAVAEGEEAGAVFDLVAREVAGLLGYVAARILRFEGGRGTVVGAWGATGAFAEVRAAHAALPPSGGSAVARVFRSEAFAADVNLRDLDEPLGRELAGIGLRAMVAAPIRVDARLWGSVVAATTDAGPRRTRWSSASGASPT